MLIPLTKLGLLEATSMLSLRMDRSYISGPSFNENLPVLPAINKQEFLSNGSLNSKANDPAYNFGKFSSMSSSSASSDSGMY